MPSLRVVKELDVVEDIGSSVFTREINFAMCPLSLNQLEEALRHNVIASVTATTHAADNAMGLQEGSPVTAGELTPLKYQTR